MSSIGLGTLELRPRRAAARRTLGAASSLLPGLLAVGATVACAYVLSGFLPGAAPAIVAMGLGVLAGPMVRRSARTAAGVAFSARTLLRIGVALLGLRISLAAVGTLGASGLAVAVGTVATTMLVTISLGRRLGVSRELTLLVAAGSSICGASAVAAMNSVSQADEGDVGYAIGTVTLFGSVAMVTLPLLGPHVLGLSDAGTGLWAGASVHEVAQAAGAGAAISVAALKLATVMKLTRVVLLAPTVAIAAVLRGQGASRRIPVPAFVLAFLGLMVLRAAVSLPHEVLHAGTLGSTLLLSAALAALGLQLRPTAFVRLGGRPLLLGLASWITAATVSLSLLLAFGLT